MSSICFVVIPELRQKLVGPYFRRFNPAVDVDAGAEPALSSLPLNCVGDVKERTGAFLDRCECLVFDVLIKRPVFNYNFKRPAIHPPVY